MHRCRTYANYNPARFGVKNAQKLEVHYKPIRKTRSWRIPTPALLGQHPHAALQLFG